MAVHRDTQIRATKSGSQTPTAIAEAGSRVQSGARQAVAEGSSRANELSAVAGDTLKSAAEAIRGRAPREGMLGTAATVMADGLEEAGLYLQEENLAAITDDVARVIRRYPVQALLVGATIGFLLGRIRR